MQVQFANYLHRLLLGMYSFLHKPVQLYPSPSKPTLQAHRPSWQNAFGPQEGEQPDVTAASEIHIQLCKMTLKNNII